MARIDPLKVGQGGGWTGRRRVVVVVAAVAYLALSVGIIALILRQRQRVLDLTGTHTEISLCGQTFHLRDGYIARYQTPALADRDPSAFLVVPLDSSSRPESLDDVLTPSWVLGGDATRELSLPETIEEGIDRHERAEVLEDVEYTSSRKAGCSWTTSIDLHDSSVFSPPPAWILVVHAYEIG